MDSILRARPVATPVVKPTSTAEFDEKSYHTPSPTRRVMRRRLPLPRSTRAVQYSIIPSILVMIASLYGGFQRYSEGILEEIQIPHGDPECAALTQWIRENGGLIRGVQCINSPSSGGRAIVSVGQLNSGSTYSKIPRDLWFWDDSVIKFSDVGEILDEDEFLEKELGAIWGINGEPVRLVFALMYEAANREKSWWRPFLDTFPPLPTSPIWWDESQIDELESTVLANRVTLQQNDLEKMYNKYMPYLADKYPEYFNSTELDLDAFKWAALHMYGRAFDATHVSRKHIRTWAMIPYIDLVNHGSYTVGGYGDSKSDSNPTAEGPFVATTTECQLDGGELLHSYGDLKSATHYFIVYGFIPTGYSQMDYVSISVSPEILELNQEIAGKHKYPWRHGVAGTDGRVTEAFLRGYGHYIHALAMRANLPDNAPHKKYLDYNWGVRRAMVLIIQAVKLEMGFFSTTYEEDLEELQGPFSGYNNWVVLTARTRYKRILHEIINSLEARLKSTTDTYPDDPALWSLAYQSSYISSRKAIDNIDGSLFEIIVPHRLNDCVLEFDPRYNEEQQQQHQQTSM